jgi:hypothetical protein
MLCSHLGNALNIENKITRNWKAMIFQSCTYTDSCIVLLLMVYFLYLECTSSCTIIYWIYLFWGQFTVFNADFSHLFFANKKLQKCILFPFQMLNDIFNYVDVVLFHWVKFVFSFTKKFHYFIGINVNPFKYFNTWSYFTPILRLMVKQIK